VTAKGKTYVYLSKGRGTDRATKPIRLPHDTSSPDFWAAYHAALGQPLPKPPCNTVAQLISEYKVSPEWKQLGQRTRVNWALHLSRIEIAWGRLRVDGLQPKHVLALRDKFADRPAAANNMLRALSSLLSWAIPRGWRTDNPCRHVPKLKGGEGYAPWPWEMIALVRDNGPAWMWQAVALALYSGQREGDCLSATWQAVRENRLRVKQEKTGLEIDIPLHRDLAAVLATITKQSTHILVSTKRRPWTSSGFRSSWRKTVLGALGKPSPLKPIADAGLTFHGLRKSAVVMLLEAGCTEAETQSITGQSSKMIAHYAKRVDRAKLAAHAIRKWESA
jgi:integrase